MTVLGSITDILVTEFGVSFPPASLWVTPGWVENGGEGVFQKQWSQKPQLTWASP